MRAAILFAAACTANPDAPTGAEGSGAPTVNVTIPARGGLRDLLAPAFAVDPDGDPVELAYAWTRNGEETSFTASRVSATEVWPGDAWAVTVTATDPDGNRGIGSAEATVPEPLGGNVLVIVLDDVGVDKLTMYGLAEGAPTPTLDALADEGLRFTHAWAYPTCSPTRAAALSGRHPYRHGTGHLVDMATSAYAHPLGSVFLPQALAEARDGQVWTSIALGKWHLAGDVAPDQLAHPLHFGFSHFAGSPGYLNESVDEFRGYFEWRKNVDGVAITTDGYNTTDTVDDALATIPALPEPWFVWLSFNAAHTPYHAPPADLFTQPLPEVPGYPDKFEAMLEALDTELGRMLAGLPADLLAQTTIIVIGDNGTSDLVAVEFDPAQSKGSVYEGGVRVPLIVVSRHVAAPGRVVDAPVMAVDLFPTILDLAGVPLVDGAGGLALPMHGGDDVGIDGVSWVPLLTDPGARPSRTVVYTESLKPNGPPPWGTHTRAVADGRFKLHRTIDGADSLFDLQRMDGLNQADDLLAERLSDEALAAYEHLAAILDRTGLDDQYDGY